LPPPPTGDSLAEGAALTPSGQIIIAGNEYLGATVSNPQWIGVARYQNDVGAPPILQDTIFSPSSAPASDSVYDPSISTSSGVSLGLKFTSDVAGSVTGIRFYKGTKETGTQTGQLWTASGQLLASVTFVNESASGWQQANFSTPVNIGANTTYIISYTTTSQYIAYTANALASSGIDNAPLHVISSSAAQGNGVYTYGGGFPTNYNGQSPNYWVDVVFAPTSNSPPPPATTDTLLGSAAPAANSQNVSDPTIASSGGVELGTKFTSDVAGVVTGVRFYKGSQETGAQTAELWSGTGQLLATAAFTNESASGWQQVSFSSPVSIAANTTYIVSYHTTSATIAYTAGGMSGGLNSSPLHALASGSGTSNGVYTYGASAFPTVFNGQSPNYWVDVNFSPS
jgi:hypothetical protein